MFRYCRLSSLQRDAAHKSGIAKARVASSPARFSIHCSHRKDSGASFASADRVDTQVTPTAGQQLQARKVGVRGLRDSRALTTDHEWAGDRPGRRCRSIDAAGQRLMDPGS